MEKVTIIDKGSTHTLYAEKGTLLSQVIAETGIDFPHICGGKGFCKKCKVKVDGKETLSCCYTVEKDITVILNPEDEIISFTKEDTCFSNENLCLCFDIGTTTVLLSLCKTDENKIIKTLHRNNPQRKQGADVMSRIEAASKGFAHTMQKEILTVLNEMTKELFAQYPINKKLPLYVSGNTVMLHLFFGADCSKIGVSPYKPDFLESITVSGNDLGIEKISTVTSLPCISAFVGGDIAAGINLVGKPKENEHFLFVDLGTNAEIALISQSKILCTSAAAGPCFEGANISQGMSAVKGSIFSVKKNGKTETIGGEKAKGFCATGLIDALSFLLENEIFDETGYMECDKYEFAEDVFLTQEDVRQFQCVKSAVYSAIECLLDVAELTPEKISKLFVSGGFAHKMNIESACNVGLFPKEMKDVFSPIDNSSLRGTLKFASEKNDLSHITTLAEYIDLSCSSLFSERFIENMYFN